MATASSAPVCLLCEKPILGNPRLCPTVNGGQPIHRACYAALPLDGPMGMGAAMDLEEMRAVVRHKRGGAATTSAENTERQGHQS